MSAILPRRSIMAARLSRPAPKRPAPLPRNQVDVAFNRFIGWHAKIRAAGWRVSVMEHRWGEGVHRCTLVREAR